MSSCVDVDPDVYYNVWNSSDDFCAKTLKGNVYLPSGEINPEGTEWAQDAMSTVINRYFNAQGGIKPVGSVDRFQEYLHQLCLDVPQACNEGLNTLCAKYTRESASGNGNIADFCGCHMIPSTYAVYANQYAIGKECDPLCARTTTVPFTNADGIVQDCKSNICIIDDVTLNLTNTSVGDINFKQACGGCTGTASCQCSISGLSLTTAEAELGNIDLEQYCQSGVTCYRANPTDPNLPAVEVDCDLPDDYVPPPPEENPEPISEEIRLALIIILAVFFGIVVILSLILILVATKKSPSPILQTEYIVTK